MKKVLFLTLFLMIFGAASVKAQVRIGGNGVPHGAAVLDLNADDTNNGTKTLALPRVSLTSTADKMGNVELLSGMLVYNTSAGGLSEGVYYWDGSQWVKPNSTAYTGSTSITLSGSEIRRAALTGDVTAAENDNVTTIADNSITSAKIVDGAVGTGELADGAVTGNKIDQMSAGVGDVLAFDGLQWAATSAQAVLAVGAGTMSYLLLDYAGSPITDALPVNCRITTSGAQGGRPSYLMDPASLRWYAGPATSPAAEAITSGHGGNPPDGVACYGRTCWVKVLNYDGDYKTTTHRLAVPVLCW